MICFTLLLVKQNMAILLEIGGQGIGVGHGCGSSTGIHSDFVYHELLGCASNISLLLSPLWRLFLPPVSVNSTAALFRRRCRCCLCFRFGFMCFGFLLLVLLCLPVFCCACLCLLRCLRVCCCLLLPFRCCRFAAAAASVPRLVVVATVALLVWLRP